MFGRGLLWGGIDLIEQSIQGFVEGLAACEPVPGGGAAAALAGGMGAALGAMAIQFTVGKKKYADLREDLERDLALLEELSQGFLSLVEEDAAAFLPLSRVYAMPNGTQEEKEARELAMEAALMDAVQPPLGMLRLCRRTADALERIERMVSPLMISDVGCAATLTQSCAQAAALNVLVNAKLLRDDTVAQRLIRETQETSRQVAEILGPVYAKVEGALCRRY